MPKKKLQEIGIDKERFFKLLRSRVVGIQSFWRQDKKIKAKINMSTGIMLTNQLILTAAHNIYVNQYKRIANDIRIIFMQDEHNLITDRNISMLMKPILHQDVEILFKDNEQKKGFTLDLAVIKLKRIQKIQNDLNLQYFDQSRFGKQVAIVSGFPDLKSSQNTALRNQNQNELITELRIDIGSITKLSSDYMYYSQIDTVTGQSGGPIFIYFERKLYLVGIHAEYNQKSRSGKGIMFTEKVFEKLIAWSYDLKVEITKQKLSQDTTDYSTAITSSTLLEDSEELKIPQKSKNQANSLPTNESCQNISENIEIQQLQELNYSEDTSKPIFPIDNSPEQPISFNKDHLNLQFYQYVLSDFLQELKNLAHQVNFDTKD